jgi:hypothetical protein
MQERLRVGITLRARSGNGLATLRAAGPLILAAAGSASRNRTPATRVGKRDETRRVARTTDLHAKRIRIAPRVSISLDVNAIGEAGCGKECRERRAR